MTYDNVNPDHYKGDRQFEPIAVIEDWNLNYRLGNALKYLSRNGRKPGEDPREGLRKAIWYLEREISSLSASEAPYTPESDEWYNEVITYYGQTQDEKEAWPEVPSEVTSNDWNDFWQDDTYKLYATDGSVFLERQDGPVGTSGIDFLWDPTLGPVELDQEEVGRLLSSKDLNQFEEDEIVSTVEKRGFILGVKKDGSTCVLKDGRCEL